jgi:hypothetical protein
MPSASVTDQSSTIKPFPNRLIVTPLKRTRRPRFFASDHEARCPRAERCASLPKRREGIEQRDDRHRLGSNDSPNQLIPTRDHVVVSARQHVIEGHCGSRFHDDQLRRLCCAHANRCSRISPLVSTTILDHHATVDSIRWSTETCHPI